MSASAALFFFTLRQSFRDMKFWLVVTALFLPCVLVGVVRYFGPPQNVEQAWALYHGLIHFMFLLGLVPLACMIHGAGLIGTEVEARTITYLITRRLKRRTVLAVRFAAALTALTLACWAALIALHFCVVVNRDWVSMSTNMGAPWSPVRDLTVYLGLMPAALAGFLALFALIGIVFSKPLAWSLVYFVIFELILGNIPADVSRYSIIRQLRSWAVAMMPSVERLGSEVMVADSRGLRNVILVAVIALVFACIRVSRRELVPGKVARD
jgi:ABC-type transport system involved in multi-copper enzyme maturation permease subunit